MSKPSSRSRASLIAATARTSRFVDHYMLLVVAGNDRAVHFYERHGLHVGGFVDVVRGGASSQTVSLGGEKAASMVLARQPSRARPPT